MEYSIRHWRQEQPGARRVEAGEGYGLALILQGTAHFFWQGQSRCCGTEDLVLMKPGAAATLQYPGGRCPLELLWVQLSPGALAALSDAETDLEAGFNVVPFSHAVVRANSEMLMLIKSLARRINALPAEQAEYGAALFEEGLLKMFVVLVLRACILTERHSAPASRRHLMMDEVFRYIHLHIAEELTLDQLARAFYVDRCHLAREFKRRTGQTVHSYIVKTKLDLCCRYIEQGRPITEVYRLGGFGGYNHFFRAFKREYGMTPKQYYRTTRPDARARGQQGPDAAACTKSPPQLKSAPK